jgi:hypothetical protein
MRAARSRATPVSTARMAAIAPSVEADGPHGADLAAEEGVVPERQAGHVAAAGEQHPGEIGALGIMWRWAHGGRRHRHCQFDEHRPSERRPGADS